MVPTVAALSKLPARQWAFKSSLFTVLPDTIHLLMGHVHTAILKFVKPILKFVINSRRAFATAIYPHIQRVRAHLIAWVTAHVVELVFHQIE